MKSRRLNSALREFWARDNKPLSFVTEKAVTKRHDELHRHVLGTGSTDRLYFEPDELFDLSVDRSRDKAFIFLISGSKLSTEVRFFPAAGPDAPLRLVQPREADHKYFAAHPLPRERVWLEGEST